MTAHWYWNRRTLEAIQIRREHHTIHLDCDLHISPVWNPLLDATWTDLSSPNYCIHPDLSNLYPEWRHFTHHHHDVIPQPTVNKQHFLSNILSVCSWRRPMWPKHPDLFDPCAMYGTWHRKLNFFLGLPRRLSAHIHATFRASPHGQLADSAQNN